MKILVTGAIGFLGINLLLEARAVGHEIFSYDLRDGRDILSQDAFILFCMQQKPDVVVHAAAVADLYESDNDLEKNFKVNVLGTFFIARICSILKIPLVYISTCCLYGNQSLRKLTDEDSMPRPTETYAWSKLAGENALNCAGFLKAIILRLGTFYGPKMRDTLFTDIVIRKILNNEEILIHGDGEQTRRFIYVTDVAAAIIKACDFILENKDSVTNNIQVFNVLGDEEISMNDVVRTVRNITGKKANVKHVEQRPGQIYRQLISGEKAKLYFKWQPKISFSHGMEQCVEWHKTLSK